MSKDETFLNSFLALLALGEQLENKSLLIHFKKFEGLGKPSLFFLKLIKLN